MPNTTRRGAIAATAALLAAARAAAPRGAFAQGSTAPEVKKATLGFIALTGAIITVLIIEIMGDKLKEAPSFEHIVQELDWRAVFFYIALFALVGGRVPSYLGSSFAFIAVVIAATGYAGSGANANISVALGGIVAAGIVYVIIGIIVVAIGYRWIDRLMPPVVTGSVVAVIGLNLAPIAVKGISAAPLDTWIGVATIVAVGLIGLWRLLATT